MSTIWIKARNRMIAILHDMLIIPAAWFSAFWLRYNLEGIPSDEVYLAFSTIPMVFLTQMAAYWSVGLYRGIWRFASLPDLLRIFKAVLIGSSISLFILFFTTRLQGIPRSVLPIYGMLLVIGLGGSRFLVRWLKDNKRWVAEGIPVLVIGADQAGEGLVRDLLRQTDHNYKPIAFVDDRSRKQGQEIHGIPVMGHCADIPRVVQQHQIGLIIIAMPDARAEDMRRIVSYCEGTGCPVRTLPALGDLVSGRVSVDLLREVSLEDLLGRDPVSLDWEAIRGVITGKVVLVTGGGGSIGSELCRQIARFNPSHLVVVERSEFNLFMLVQELDTHPTVKFAWHLVDVCDEAVMQQIFSQYCPHIVFHAAAYKHVPLLQAQPREAVKNNVFGTRTIAQLALSNRVEKFILVSSDKAVNPTNIMGATKRVSEIICENFNGRGVTKFITVRFGNVLGSTGSVVPIFKQQLEKGGPITVTHPEISRFFMTIPEACQLVLEALAIGKGGEIFVLDMGEPIKIRFLAEQMIRLAGKKLGEDIEILYTGLRPGEKLFEELFYPGEMLGTTTHKKIFQAESARRRNVIKLSEIFERMATACHECDDNEMIELLQLLVPELELKTNSPVSLL